MTAKYLLLATLTCCCTVPAAVHAEKAGTGILGCTKFTPVGKWTDDYRAEFDLAGDTIASAELNYTLDHGSAESRRWLTAGAVVTNGEVTAHLPTGSTGFYVSARTVRGAKGRTVTVTAPPAVEGMETLIDMKPTEANPRNGEGDTVMLKDGRMLFAWARFGREAKLKDRLSASGGSDNYSASIYRLVSPDGGCTWPGTPVEMIPNDGGLNLMCVSFLRLGDGRLAVFYLKKNSMTDCRPWMRVSDDEGETWGEARACVDDGHVCYYVVNNARVIRLSTGRILIPMARHGLIGDNMDWNGSVLAAWSDDDGKTWGISKQPQEVYYPDGRRNAAHEPGLVELRDGRVMMNIRSHGNLMYASYSADGGESWSRPEPALGHGPDSPATLARLFSGELVMVYNDHEGVRSMLGRIRSPLVICVSEDDGRTWTRHRSVEDDLTRHTLCYTSVREHDGRLYLSYYSRSGLTWLSLKALPIASVLAE